MYYFKMKPPKGTKTQAVTLHEFQKTTQPHTSKKVWPRVLTKAFSMFISQWTRHNILVK